MGGRSKVGVEDASRSDGPDNGHSAAVRLGMNMFGQAHRRAWDAGAAAEHEGPGRVKWKAAGARVSLNDFLVPHVEQLGERDAAQDGVRLHSCAAPRREIEPGGGRQHSGLAPAALGRPRGAAAAPAVGVLGNGPALRACGGSARVCAC